MLLTTRSYLTFILLVLLEVKILVGIQITVFDLFHSQSFFKGVSHNLDNYLLVLATMYTHLNI